MTKAGDSTAIFNERREGGNEHDERNVLLRIDERWRPVTCIYIHTYIHQYQGLTNLLRGREIQISIADSHSRFSHKSTTRYEGRGMISSSSSSSEPPCITTTSLLRCRRWASDSHPASPSRDTVVHALAWRLLVASTIPPRS